MNRRTFPLAAMLLACLVAVAGCKKSPPPVVAASGRVLLNGKPLPFASIEFMPELKDFGAEMNSSGVTDEKGEFTLTCSMKSQPGAALGPHRVVVTDSTPDEMRGTDQRSQERLSKHQRSLANRPIPPQYGNYVQTPLRVTVEKGKTTYELELTR